jgi:quercetin dioxygenase-like cupin family protein
MDTHTLALMRQASMSANGRSRSLAGALSGLLWLVAAAAWAADDAVVSSLEVEYRQKVLENDAFTAYRVSIPASHATVMHRHDTDILTVFISGGKTRTVIQGEPPRVEDIPAGTVRFRPAGFTHATENHEATDFRFVVLEFKKSVGARQPALPQGSRVCTSGDERACVEQEYRLCTAAVCARSIVMAPMSELVVDALPFDQLLVAVSDAELSSGQGALARVAGRKSGDVEYLKRGAALRWRNIAPTPAHLVMLEFRAPGAR